MHDDKMLLWRSAMAKRLSLIGNIVAAAVPSSEPDNFAADANTLLVEDQQFGPQHLHVTFQFKKLKALFLKHLSLAAP